MSRIDDLAVPPLLTPQGKQVCENIVEYLQRYKLTSTNGCKTFYSPEEWLSRGEKYGKGSVLIVVYEGSDVREAFDSEYKYDHEEGMRGALDRIGFYPERCTHWYSAIYPV